ncbi:uncharacterized protein plekhg2 isoform X1 [Silurus meridionalis]|nr:uncharacterized protein plekhg2 isoform X1 [Silurus meridionalis]XP_046718874.1 uncharacterized protein plekhg2 isoform X1 [Silurus meridionalis]XP_046718875.1 uncharacterized protein plekhg2 isoform X1 [Silurus meridionalis]
MPEGAGRDSQKKSSNQGAKRPSSVSSLSGIVSRMASSGGTSRGSCTSVNTVCSDSDRGASLSSSTSSASLQDGHSSSSSSSLPSGAVPSYKSLPQRNGSDISLDLTPLSGSAPSPSTTMPKLSRLQRVLLEIVETEQAYVRDLKSIVEDYLGCIIDCGDLPLKPEEVSTLFCNIEDIYEFNSELLEDLERSPDAAAIAECFVERSEAFDIYTIYCMNYPNSVAVLRECMKNESLVRFFQERQATLCHSLPLEAYLLKPVQRILKYHLLLQELSKHFDKSDSGYEVVEDAIITMTAVAWYINDMKRKQEHAVRLQEIENLLLNWTGPDLSGFGELVLEGSFRVQRVKKERAFFLFDKMLLIAKKRMEHFIYSTHIFCCNLLLVETMKDPLCFKVSDQTIPKQQHIVQAKNQEEKRLWLHYLKRLIVENHPASLPQKARQVLGDNFCQSPQYEQEPTRKPVPSPRLDDAHGFQRGRRQSEPPEFIYTPEKAKKSLPLLLEGNLPYRRGRRQSAPAKDIEAVFQQGVTSLKAGSEGELYTQVESLASSGSASTLASSVIEVGSGQDKLCLGQDEDEDMSPLPTPPTLSITEEIMQFINESRAREGMAELSSNVSEPRSEACIEPEDLIEYQKTQEIKEKDQLNSVSSRPPDKQPLIDNEANQDDDIGHDSTTAKDFGGDTSSSLSSYLPKQHENRSESLESEVVMAALVPEHLMEKEDEDTVAEDKISPLTNKIEEMVSKTAGELCDNSASTHKTADNPLLPKGEVEQKSHHQIIEKIRSYYEAAEAVADDGQASRRNSFSNIPAGLVKDSVSRYNFFVHQVSLCDSESGRSDCNENDLTSISPAEPDKDLKTFSQPDDTTVDALAEHTSQSKTELKSNNDEQICDFRPCMELWKDKEKITLSIQEKEKACKESSFAKDKEVCAKDLLPATDRRTSVLNDQLAPEEDHNESTDFKTSEPKDKTAKEAQSTAVPRDKSNPNGSLDSLPSQIKVGRWSRHGKAVSCSRTLYEGIADVSSIGFFESAPMDQCLVENSDKILSKVQMLAQMYMAKSSSMKVPLHQKRTRVTKASCKVNSPPKSQILLNQAEENTQNQLSDIHMESVTHSTPESFGHVIVKEQFTSACHQENYHDITGQKEQVTIFEASATEIISLESSTITEFPSEKEEEHLPTNMGTQSYLESSTDQDILSDENQDTPAVQSSGSQVKYCLEQDHTLYSIKEDHSIVDKNPTSDRKDEHKLLVVDKPVMDCCSKSRNDSKEGSPLKVEASAIKESHGLMNTPCENPQFTEETVGDSQMRLSINSDSTDDPIICTKVDLSSVNVVDTSLPTELSQYLGNGVSETTCDGNPRMSPNVLDVDVSPQSCSSQLQYQCYPETSCTNVPPLHGLREMVTPQTLGGNKKLSMSNHSQTSAFCKTGTNNLTKSNSQRAGDFHNEMGSKISPWRTDISSQRLSQAQTASMEQDQDTTQPCGHHSSSKNSLCNKSPSFPLQFYETKPSVFGLSLRMRSPSPNMSYSNSQTNSSALAKSLAASCISQSISQNIAKRNARMQAISPPANSSSLPTSSLRRRSPSPKPAALTSNVQKDSSTSPTKVTESQILKCSPSPSCSTILRSSPATVQSPPPNRNEHFVPPASPVTHSMADQSLHTELNSNNNNNNNGHCSNAWANSNKKPLSSSLSSSQIYRGPHEPHRETSHNRIARPFLSSEPNSRVQSPSNSPSLFTRICSPPLVQNSAGPLVTKPPNPRTPRQSGSSPFIPLSLEFSQTTSSSILSPCTSPRVTSPPPIGIPTNIWCIVSPQPRNPLVTPSSPTKTEATSRGSRITSPVSGSSSCSTFFSQSQRRARGSNLSFDSLTCSPTSPLRNEHRSFAENGQWTMDSELHSASPQMRSCNGSPMCVSPEPQYLIRENAGKSTDAEKQLTHFNWPQVHELPPVYNTVDNSQCNLLPSPSSPETEQGDSELGKGTCRSSLICAYVAQATSVPEKDTYIQPSDDRKQVDNVPTQGTKTQLKTSYATTVNLQIAGSGRIASFSNAQVSLTQTLAPVTESQGMRRVSINGCTLSMQNCKRL